MYHKRGRGEKASKKKRKGTETGTTLRQKEIIITMFKTVAIIQIKKRVTKLGWSIKTVILICFCDMTRAVRAA